MLKSPDRIIVQVQIELIKTLPHLIPLHLHQQRAVLHATHYSIPLQKYFHALYTIGPDATLDTITQKLSDTGWQRVTRPETPQTYSVLGDTLNIYPPGYSHPVRIEFDFDTIQSIYTYDEIYGRKLADIPAILLSSNYLALDADLPHIHIAEQLVSTETNHLRVPIYLSHLPYIAADQQFAVEISEYDFAYPHLFWSRTDLLEKEVHRLQTLDYAIKIISRHLDTLPTAAIPAPTDHPLWEHLPAELSAGFISAKEKVAVFTDREIFGTVYLTKRKSANSNTSKLLAQFEGEISVGDYIVHEGYGVAIYAGLTQELIDNELQEYLQLKYAQTDELLIPVSQIEKLTKYIGPEGVEPKLSRLGRADWNQLKSKTKKSVMILARELLEHYAAREIATATAIDAQDSADYTHFVNQFAYTETDDQLRATNEIIADMQKTIPMNRLLIGDVGFGKTEVIMRATFKAAEAGMQVAILCPTTVLCAQHYNVLTERFKHTKYKVTNLSRFNTASQNDAHVDLINKGEAQIIVGTHALLRSDLKFQKLGLLVVDEEQKFGVAQKEKIKKLDLGTHHLSVSATPIPRTLGMALSSIQDISIITQPPVGRKPITTEVTKLDWNKVADAVKNEIDRRGQIYFVHNRVQNIQSVAARLQKVLPGVRIITAHGQMSPNSLDKQITDFYEYKADVLLCTTIIENGLDMPNVNTMIIHQAEMFGLSQLHQLRGRVGRSDKQAFCYLFYTGRKVQVTGDGAQITESGETDSDEQESLNKVTPEYLKRLEAMAQSTELGAGFSIASRDLELRGAGNLLGSQQHGHINEIGYALYMQMLAGEVERLRELKEEIG